MKLSELREALDALEAEVGTDELKVGIVCIDPKTGRGQLYGIGRVTRSTYEDPGEVNHVAWLHTDEY